MFRRATAVLSYRIRIGRRTVLVMLSLLIAAAAVYVYRAARQRQAVTAIRQWGGEVAYDYQLTSDVIANNAPSWVPARLRRPVGDDYFHSVVFVHVTYGSRRPSSIPTVAADDEYFTRLIAFPGLKHLTLNQTVTLTDRGVRRLSDLHRLETLCLRHAALTDDSVQPLSELPRLETLDLQENHITDGALAHVGRIKTLRVLWVGCDSRNPAITDDGLIHLTKLKRLQGLDLAGTAVTDKGIAYLKGLNLHWLRVQRTAVRDIAAIREAFPECALEYSLQVD